MTTYYPVLLHLEGRLCVVVGGGTVAEEKVGGLLEAGASVRLIAPRLTPLLEQLARAGEIEHLPRAYRDGDLAGAFLAFAERLGEKVHMRLADEAQQRVVPLNVQDETPYCSFIAASLLRRGDLTIAISTSGKAPALAVRLRQTLERCIGDHYGRFLEIAGRLRSALLRRHPDFETRRELWYRLVDSDVLELLERGDDDAAHARIEEVMGVVPEATRVQLQAPVGAAS